MEVLKDPRQAPVLAAITGCIMPQFAVMDALLQRAQDQGVPEETAASYISRFFQAVCAQAVHLNAAGIREMARVSTPGGINHMVTDWIAAAGGFRVWAEAMDLALQPEFRSLDGLLVPAIHATPPMDGPLYHVSGPQQWSAADSLKKSIFIRFQEPGPPLYVSKHSSTPLLLNRPLRYAPDGRQKREKHR